MPSDHLFVTGCYRSGTTLLEKLLHQHRSIAVASQPAPVLYFHAKQRFLEERGLTRRYPLGHLFAERSYRPSEFASHLARQHYDTRDLAAVFAALADYHEGLWTPQTLDLRNQIEPGPFLWIQEQIHDQLAARLGKADASITGGKEILAEEFAPFLLDAGHRVIIIIRDPRDMIASLDYRERNNLTGAHRPLLYSLRLWRKSVAFALSLNDHPNFAWLRFEDLLDNPSSELSRVAGLEFDSEAGQSIESQQGGAWQGNSSFTDTAGIDPGVAGRFQRVLPDNVIEYIEALTAPEMRTLRYERVTSATISHSLMQRFCEPFPLHANFAEGYGLDSTRIESEIRRNELLRASQVDEDEIAALFLYPSVWRVLSGRQSPSNRGA